MSEVKHTEGLLVSDTPYPGQYWIKSPEDEPNPVQLSGYFGSYSPHLFKAAPEMFEALKARREAREFAAQVSAATPDGETPAKHLMDTADLLFAKADRLEAEALSKAGGQHG